MFRVLFLFLATLILGLFSAGCETLDLSKLKTEPVYTVNIYHIVKYPGNEKAEEMEVPLETFDGRTLWINRHGYLDSKDFSEARLVPIPDKPDFFKVELKLSRHGRQRWAQMIGRFRGDYMALCIDSRHYTSFICDGKIDDIGDENWVLLNAELDTDTANNIVKNAPTNYAHFNPTTDSLW